MNTTCGRPRRRNPHVRSRTSACELFAALMKADRTRADLMEMTGMSEKLLDAWLDEFRASGIVYLRAGPGDPNKRGRVPALVCLQSRPFEQVDEV